VLRHIALTLQFNATAAGRPPCEWIFAFAISQKAGADNAPPRIFWSYQIPLGGDYYCPLLRHSPQRQSWNFAAVRRDRIYSVNLRVICMRGARAAPSEFKANSYLVK